MRTIIGERVSFYCEVASVIVWYVFARETPRPAACGTELTVCGLKNFDGATVLIENEV